MTCETPSKPSLEMRPPSSIGPVMRALQIIPLSSGSAPCTIACVSLPIPSRKPGFALIKVHYSAMQPSDRLNSQGGFSKTTLPRIPGRDFSGAIVHSKNLPCGTLVFGTGDRTTGFTVDGTHADYALIPEELCIVLPDGLDSRLAATLGVPYSTALRCLMRTRVANTDTVLILGSSGSVGSAAVQLCQALDYSSVVTASRREGNGADLVLTMTPIILQSKISELTRGHGIDVVIDTIGDIGIMSTALGLLNDRGRYVWIAAPRDGTPPVLSLDTLQTYRKEIELFGCNSALKTVAETKAELLILAKLIENGKLEPTKHAECIELSVENAIEFGYKSIESGRGVLLKFI